MQSIYIKTTVPTNVSVSPVNKAYEDIKVAKSQAKKVYIDLTIMLGKSDKFKSKHAKLRTSGLRCLTV